VCLTLDPLTRCSGSDPHPSAEPTAQRLPWDLDAGLTYVAPEFFDIASVLGDGTTVVRNCNARSSFTGYHHVLHSAFPSDARTIGSTSTEIQMCMSMYSHLGPSNCYVKTQELLKELGDPAFDAGGTRVYLYSEAVQSIVSFRVVRERTVNNLSRTRFVDGEFLLGGMPGDPHITGGLLNDVTANSVDDLRALRINLFGEVQCSTSFRTEIVAATDCGIYVLLPTEAGLSPRRVLWRLRPGMRAERIDIPELQNRTDWNSGYAQALRGPNGTLFLRVGESDGHGYLTRVKWMLVHPNGSVKTIYEGNNCDDDYAACDYYGGVAYDASTDRLLVSRLHQFPSATVDPLNPQLNRQLKIVSVDYGRYADIGGVDIASTYASPVLYRFKESDSSPHSSTWSGCFPWNIRATDWHLLPDGRIRVISGSTQGPVFGYQGVIDLSTRAAASAKTGMTYTFSRDGLAAETRDPMTLDLIRSYAYGPNHTISAIFDASGNRTSVERNAAGFISAIVGPYGHRTTLTYDTDNRLTSLSDPLENNYSFTYHGATLLLKSLTNPEGHSSTFAFDTSGRLTSDRDAAGGEQTLSVESLPDGGYATTHRDGDGVETRYERPRMADGADVLRVVRADETASQTTRDQAEGVDTTVLADGTSITTTYSPDPVMGAQLEYPSSIVQRTAGNRSRTTSVSRQPTFSNTDVVTGFIERISQGGNTRETTYDRPTRTRVLRSPEGRASLFQYDDKGRLTGAQLPGVLPVNFSYDARGRMISALQGERASTFAYATDNRSVIQTLPDSGTVATTFDAAGRLLTSSSPGGNFSELRYDRISRVVGLTPPEGQEHLHQRSVTGLVSAYRTPLGSEETIEYSLGWRMERRNLADGSVIDPVYGQDGKLRAVNVPGGTYSYAYVPTTGKLDSVTSSDGNRIAYTQDGPLLISSHWSSSNGAGPSGDVTLSYDGLWRPDTIRVNGTILEVRTYDRDDLLKTMQVYGNQSGNLGTMALTRDAASGRLSSTSFRSITTAHSYNGYGEPAGFSASHGATLLYSISDVTRDLRGRITSEDEAIQEISVHRDYAYDADGRLQEVRIDGEIAAQYAYDANGSRLSRTAGGSQELGTYDAADRVLSYGEFEHGFSNAGHLQATTRSGTDERTSYTYDVFGALRGVSLSSGLRVDYEIDPVGRRVGKKVDGAVTKRWLYLGALRPVAEFDSLNQIVARFVYADRDNVPAIIVKGSTVYRVIADFRGSVRLVVDATTGAVAQRLDYDEFGRVQLDTNPGFQPFGFAGGLYDPDTGLVRFGARDYDPYVGQWTARDPILFEGGDTNLYRYASSDPINFVDPTGLDIWIEGASGNEPGLHQSINIGDPFGRYDSYSFAINGGGWVYNDIFRGGPIERYLDTTPAQDAEARQMIRDQTEADNGMWYGPNTCRSYSQEKFEFFRDRLGVPESMPPNRTPVPQTTWGFLRNILGVTFTAVFTSAGF
jgi:RHS repeat-associated protein